MGDRFVLVTKIRDRLYQCDVPTLPKLVKVYKENEKSDDRCKALRILEDVIELTAKDTDDSVAALEDMWEGNC